ncbi:MAG: patatin-like phospholipase family protein [Gammaproteobacteria bacterium]|nr:patatin-like phospholipase family protein [Gammaproteobacteria bacterium]
MPSFRHCCLLLAMAICVAAVPAAAEQLPGAAPPVVPTLASAAALSQPTSPAAARPRIGLVLSGGGARGAAHIGVLEVLDELRVPVDAIAGTSMGAVIGGLYASGMSGRDIAALLSSVDWQDAFRDRPKRTDLAFRRKQEDLDYLVNIPLGVRGRRLHIPRGLVQGQKLTQLLRQSLLPVSGLPDFDHLPTRLRVVATDLESGATVVMRDGDLVSALRASMSAPGVFAPVERAGRLLVDGGLTDNLPVEVGRAMGVDVLIVVDTGLALQTRGRLNSLPAVSNQAIAIMLQQNTAAQRAQLTPRDLLIAPQLEQLSSYDFGSVGRARSLGEAAARAVAGRLAALAIPVDAYARYAAARAALRQPPPRIEFVRSDTGSQLYRRQIQDLFGGFVGTTADAAALGREVTDLYGRGTLETLDYTIVRDADGRRGLEFSARRNSWGPNYLRVGLSLQDDFSGRTAFNAAGRLLITELNTLGAESVWDVRIGSAPRLATELYLPLSNVHRWFVAPHGEIEAHNLAQLAGGEQIGEYRVRSASYGLDFGRELGNIGELRGGVIRSSGSAAVIIGATATPREPFDVRAYFARFSYDHLDSALFPHSGQALTLEWRVEENLGATLGSDLLTLDWRAAVSRGKYTGIGWISGGTTVSGSEANVRAWFPLGGFLNLSGVRADSLAGPHFAVARVIGLRSIGRGGEGVLNVPAYVGMSFEIGNAWATRRAIRLSSVRRDLALFLGADTYLGPVYIAAGYDDRGRSGFYLFLGRSF